MCAKKILKKLNTVRENKYLIVFHMSANRKENYDLDEKPEVWVFDVMGVL